MLIAGRKKNCLHKRVCNYASMWCIWCKEREREFARFDRPSNYENKDEREARKKEGKNKLQGNKRGGTNVRKGGERAASSRGFRTKWSSCCVRATLFCHFLYLRASENSFHSFVFVQQASVFFKGILNYDESREIKRYFTFLWYILKYIGTTEKFQNIRLLLSVIVKNVDLAFNKRKFEIFVSWLQYCDDYSNITSFDQFKILISMKARMYSKTIFFQKFLKGRNPSFNISTYIGFSFQKMLKSGQFTCLKKRKRKLKRWFQPS